MTTSVPTNALQLRSLVRPNGELELSLQSIPVPAPAADEVLIQVQATPLNPSDIGLLFGAADVPVPLPLALPQTRWLPCALPQQR